MSLIGRIAIVCVLATSLWSQNAGTASADGKGNPPAPSSASSLPPDSTKLEPIQTVKAIYPPEAKAKGIEGTVVVKISVDETGSVDSTEVVSGDPVLASSCADALRQWKFKPYIKNGKPVRVSTSLPCSFASPNEPVRVSGGVAYGLLIHKVAPVYPQKAKRAGVQGAVQLAIVIGKDGIVKDVQVISGPSELTDAAVAAVQQWRYRPYLLMGNPVEIDSTVTINFFRPGY